MLGIFFLRSNPFRLVIPVIIRDSQFAGFGHMTIAGSFKRSSAIAESFCTFTPRGRNCYSKTLLSRYQASFSVSILEAENMRDTPIITEKLILKDEHSTKSVKSSSTRRKSVSKVRSHKLAFIKKTDVLSSGNSKVSHFFIFFEVGKGF